MDGTHPPLGPIWPVNVNPDSPGSNLRAVGRRPVILAPETGLLTVRSSPTQYLPLDSSMGWFSKLISGFVAGGIYLLAGSPGSGKSRLATQIALSAAVQGVRSLTVLTEERQDRLLSRTQMLTRDWNPSDADRAIRLMDSTVEISQLSDLPYYFQFNIRSAIAGPPTKLLIIDSVQGDGLPANAARQYAGFYEFGRRAKDAGVTIIAVAHINKRGQIAGPRGLEHNVDAVVRIERTGAGRMISVLKNRFGPEQSAGFPLMTDAETAALLPSPHREPMTGIARTFIGSEMGDAELQVQLSLPMPGEKAQVSAPGLPRRRIEQIVRSISTTRGIDLDNLNLNISSLLPGDAPYRAYLGLPLAMSLVASLLRKPVPSTHVYLGEIDLNRVLRPLPRALLDAIAEAVLKENLSPATRLFVPRTTATQLDGLGCQLVPCSSFDEALKLTWPETATEEQRD